jgi:uncharacterized protein DUF6516
MAYRAIMPKASVLIEEREYFEDASFVVRRVKHVPARVPGSRHDYKYSMSYVVQDKRVIGYDNERGKGDHRHYKDVETSYTFHSIERLLADFRADVEQERNGLHEGEQRD